MVESTKPKGQSFGLKSVFVRCAGIVALATVTVTGVLSFQSISLIRSFATSSLEEQVAKSVSLAAEALVKPIRFKAMPKIEETIGTALDAAGPNGSGMSVFGADGAVLATVGEAEIASQMETLAQAAISSTETQVSVDGLLVAQPIFASAEGPVIGAVASAWSADAALAIAFEQSIRMLATAALVFTAMMALALFLFQRVLGQPLRNVGTAISDIAKGLLDEPVGLANRTDEFGAVGKHLNALLDKLRGARETELAAAKDAEYQAEIVAELSTALNALADGVLNRDITADFKDDYATLREDYNRAVHQLRNLINEVASSATGLKDNADQIASSSEDLSRRTETQAATLEQSAAALEELLSNVDSAANNARQAASFVNETRSVAEENGAIMKSAIDAMSAIEKSSDEISAITNVIDDIAFQTNLLALNAGVEAARAGASGKGFAVVATEVRGLAQRSAAAAQQIKNLIDSSGEQVDAGVQLVKEAGETLGTVLEKVAGVSDMVNNIAAGADEQSGGLKEINVGISNLDRVTQENASMVQNSASSAFDMRAKANGLSNLVSQFDTEPRGESPALDQSEPEAERPAA